MLLLAIGGTETWAQTRTVTGRVLDEKGQGIPSAGITVKGTTVGTVTDFDGNFTISVPAGGTTFSIQAIGYTLQETTIGSSPMTVRMSTESRQLQGAVVTALAIKREKRELGYAATTLSNEDLNGANNVSALSAIQGKTAGVNITSNTGGPGGSTRIVLRGEKSVGSNNALIVVDGMIINNSGRLLDPLSSLEQVDFGNRGNDINPEDIESISVLKGPAAAALYGSLGANGAVMITTKSGRSRRTGGPKKTEVTYQSNYTLQSVLKVPETQKEFGQGNTQDIVDDRRENFSWGLPFDGKLRPWGQVIDGKQMVKPYSYQNNLRDFFDIGRTWENSASVAGSNDKSTYYLSLNTLNNKGVVPNNFYDKYSVRFNGSTELTNKLYSSINLNYINVSTRTDAMGQADGAVWDYVLGQPTDIPIRELRDFGNPFYSMGTLDANGVARYGYYGAYTKNPYWVAANYDNRNKTDRVLGALTIGFRAGKWDVFNRFGGDIISDRTNIKTPKYTYLPYDEAYYVDPSGLQLQTNNGGYRVMTANTTTFNNDLIANYSTKLNPDIGFQALIGGNIRYSRVDNTDANIDPKSNSLVIPGWYNLSNAQGPVTTLDQRFDERSVALYSSLKLDYRRTLFLELTGRNDWNSTLPIGNWSFFYPSANLSWVFTEPLKETGFVRNVMNYGKLRGGYASVGNGTTAYQTNSPGYIRNTSDYGFGSFTFPYTTPNGSVPGYTLQGTLGNANLRPERTNSWEIGAELSFLKDRIIFEGSYYQSLSIDQIIRVPLPSSTGYTSRLVNVGDISNKGVELSLRLVPLSMKNGLRWEVFGTYYKNTNEVTRLADGVSQIALGGFSGLTIAAAVGKPFGAFYAVDLQRDQLGRVVVDSSTGLPSPASTQTYKGSYQPRFIASWGTNFKFKGFTLNVLFDTKQGGVFYSHTKRNMAFTGTSPETIQNDREPYVFPNSSYQSSNGTYVANTTQMFLPYNYYIATYQNTPALQIVDASYVKLREASLYYNLPDKVLKKTPFGAVALGIYGTNLAIWTSKDNTFVDPETNSGGASNEQGFEYISRPSLRSYGMTLRVSF